jgi:glycosyltransferase involved in cell wall biosynthesis
MLVSRLLWDKGVGEFVEAARLLRGRGVQARFVLVGAPDAENRASVDEATLRCWTEEGVVEWWGRRDDIPSVLAQAHVACLPSYYREGIPKSLIEAASCGLPIVTTDTPGCREIVIDGESGKLVPPRDSQALATALEHLVGDAVLRRKMGGRGRALVEAEFTTGRVVEATLAVYRELRGSNGAADDVADGER